MTNTFYLAFAVLIAIDGVLVVYGTLVKNRWGVNFNPGSCPRCGTALPSTRPPANLRQRFWGGGTCPRCATEVDKWGRELARQESAGGPPSPITDAEARSRFKKRLAWSASLAYFAVTVFLGWPQTSNTPSGWIWSLTLALLEAGVFSVLFVAVTMVLRDRVFTRQQE